MTDRNGAPRIGVVARPQLPPRELVDAARRADAAGLDDVWLWEDCFLEGGLTSATAVLSATGDVRVGLGLMPVPMRNPALAAMEIATMAELFPGRFAPAVGHGVLDWMAQVGARVESPMTLLREWTVAVNALLDGATVTADGRYVRLDQVTLDWPPANRPPLMIGGRGPRTLALAGELAKGTVLDACRSPDDVRRAVDQIAPSPGHEVVIYLYAAVDDSAVASVHEGRPRLPREAILTGDPAAVADQVRRYAEAGADTVVLQTSGSEPDMPGFVRYVGSVRSALHR